MWRRSFFDVVRDNPDKARAWRQEDASLLVPGDGERRASTVRQRSQPERLRTKFRL